jgi:long-chain acyl-CoA synthetase
MTNRVQAPTVDEIEARLRKPSVRALRPVIHGGIGALAMMLRFGWTTEGFPAPRALDAPFILAANHASHTDTAAILGTLPAPVRRRTCVAAALDVFGTTTDRRTLPALRRECLQLVVAAGFHAFAFDRHGPPLRSVRTAADLLARGWNLLLFPEGTRSRTGGIGQFKPGVGILARMSGRPVVPVHVAGGATILPCGAFVPRNGRAVVRYGTVMRFQDGETSASFTDRLKHRVTALIPAPAVAETPPAAAPAGETPFTPITQQRSA